MKNFYSLPQLFSFKTILPLVLCFGLINETKAQLLVDPNYSASQLAQSLAGSGVTISNATVTCPTGSYGFFNGVNCNIAIDSGLVLTCGDLIGAIGPNNSSSFTGINSYFSGPACDAQLEALAFYSTYDCCILEFDVIPYGDTLKFNYSFGSEEYLEWVNSMFNDVFGFFISGPGIVGQQNIAVVPGTSTPVSINTINTGLNSAYYYNNGDGFSPPQNTDPTVVQYDGFTVGLQAIASVIPCETYHLKLAISDAGDGVLDSGVFVEAGSLQSNAVTILTATSVGPGFDNAIEGCVDGYFIFILNAPPPQDLTLIYNIAGSALNGTDYLLIADSITFPAGQDTMVLPIISIADGMTEGLEDVVIFLTTQCNSAIIDTATLWIQDSVIAVITNNDTAVCPGAQVQLDASGGTGFTWSPAQGLNDPNIQNPIASPIITTTYTVTAYLGTCTDEDYVTINMMQTPVLQLTPDATICSGDTMQLLCVGGASYLWSPAISLSNPNIQDPFAFPSQTTTYTVIATDTSGLCDAIETVTITVVSSITVTVSPDTIICDGGVAQLLASGGTNYQWFPSNTLSCSNCPDPAAMPSFPVTYTVVANSATCFDTAFVNVFVDGININITADPGTDIIYGESTWLDANDGDIWLWTPSDGLSSTNIQNPVATPTTNTTYVVESWTSIGCYDIDSINIFVNPVAPIIIPNAFTPDGIGSNNLFGVIDEDGFTLDQFIIFNRWGEKVFETTDMNEKWDGTYKGYDCEMATYVYYLHAHAPDGEVYRTKGNVTLIR